MISYKKKPTEPVWEVDSALTCLSFRACPGDTRAVKQKLLMPLGWLDIPEKLVSIGGGHLSQAGQNFVVIGVALLGYVLQNLSDLHTYNTVLLTFSHGFVHAFIHNNIPCSP